MPTRTTSERRPEQRHPRVEPSHTRSTSADCAAREEPGRPQEQDEDHEREHRRGQEDGLVGRQRAVDHAGREADREAAERRRPEPVDPADDDADEHDDRLLEREVGRDERELDGQDHRDRRGEEPGEQHGDADDAVGLDAEQPRGPEVGRGGPHLQADRRPPEQEREQPERDDRDHDGEDRHLADVDAADRHHLVQRRDRDGRLADRAVADVEDQRDAWSRKAIANVVTSITAGDCVRSGRKTDAVHRERERDTTAKQASDARRRRASPT